MRLRIKLAAALIAGLVLPIQGALAEPVINNGSLTGPVGFDLLPPGWSASIDGFVNTGDTNDPNNNVGGVLPFSVQPGPSPDGGTWVGLVQINDPNAALGATGRSDGIWQSVSDFAPLVRYEVYWYRGNFGIGPLGTGLGEYTDGRIQVLLDGVPVGLGAPFGIGPDWTYESIAFTATAATHQLELKTLTSDFAYLSIDGIAIVKQGQTYSYAGANFNVVSGARFSATDSVTARFSIDCELTGGAGDCRSLPFADYAAAVTTCEFIASGAPDLVITCADVLPGFFFRFETDAAGQLSGSYNIALESSLEGGSGARITTGNGGGFTVARSGAAGGEGRVDYLAGLWQTSLGALPVPSLPHSPWERC